MRRLLARWRLFGVVLLSTALPVPASASSSAPPGASSAACSCAQARAHVLQQARRQGLDAEVRCSLPVDEPAGSCPAAALRSPLAPLQAGPMRVVLRPPAADGAGQDRTVALRVGLRSRAWVAAAPIAAGEPLDRALLEQREVAWPHGVSPPPVAALPPEGRTRRALRAGEPVLPEVLLAPTQRRQGDAVEIVIRDGAVSVAMPGVLVRDASVGQQTRAQVSGRREFLDGLLVDPRTVVVGP